ncbi:MAG: GntR family transcriptional regulator [Bacillota bacterium]
MELEVNRKSGIPIYVQLKRQIDHLVKMGVWPAGTQLPTERELARILGISRNTVSMAYRTLEEEGVLVSRQGRGTFVSGNNQKMAESKKEWLGRLVDSLLDDCLEAGLSLDEFVEICRRRAEDKGAYLNRLTVAFVECNKEQLDYFARELELGFGVAIAPILLSNLVEGQETAVKAVEEADLVVTTFFHLEEVRDLLRHHRRQILGSALDPQLETIVRLARLPKGITVGLVCSSQQFAERVEKSIQLAGIEGLNIRTTTVRDPKMVRQALDGVQAVIVSPGRRREVASLLEGSPVEMIEFIYIPDAGSVNLLRSALMGLRNGDKRDKE